MQADGTFDVADPESAAAEVTDVAQTWQIRVPAIRMWAQAAVAYVGDGPARWLLEFDPVESLVSFEVWVNGRRAYGIDDWLG